MSAPTAIVAPLAAELAGVLAATSGRRRMRLDGGDGRLRPWLRRQRQSRLPGRRRPAAILGRVAGEDVALMATGDGPAAAAAGLEALLAAVRPRRLLVIGVAGALTPGLAEGALVAARQVIDAGGRVVPQGPDARWLAQALAAGAVCGIAVSADRIAAGPAARRAALRTALAPEAEPAAPAATAAAAVATVDLESAAYARVAAARSLPYLVVRAVLDPAEEELPLDFEACRDATGRVSNARVVLRALARPGTFVELWRLRARVRAAAARLGILAERLVAAAQQRRDNPAAAAGRRTA
ncbi:MAG: hypothetical protein JOZ15_08945 [Acidobacteria bacterium]|nr:hypothetical protein [Acidobacteriota bacterium]